MGNCKLEKWENGKMVKPRTKKKHMRCFHYSTISQFNHSTKFEEFTFCFFIFDILFPNNMQVYGLNVNLSTIEQTQYSIK